MKKQYILLSMLLAAATGLSALTEAEVKRQSNDILSGMVSGHNLAFGKDNLFKEAFDAGMWNKSLTSMKTLVNTVINENKNFVGMKDSTLVNALDKITKAEIELLNTIKTTRGVLQSSIDLQKQIAKFTQIEKDMLSVQNSLKSTMTSVAKDEARKLLNNTAMFIETTARKGAKDATQAKNALVPALPPRGTK